MSAWNSAGWRRRPCLSTPEYAQVYGQPALVRIRRPFGSGGGSGWLAAAVRVLVGVKCVVWHLRRWPGTARRHARCRSSDTDSGLLRTQPDACWTPQPAALATKQELLAGVRRGLSGALAPPAAMVARVASPHAREEPDGARSSMRRRTYLGPITPELAMRTFIFDARCVCVACLAMRGATSTDVVATS